MRPTFVGLFVVLQMIVFIKKNLLENPKKT